MATFAMRSLETTNILGSIEPVWELTASNKKIFAGFIGETCKERQIDGYGYKLTLRQTTGVNHPDKIFKDLLDACPSSLGSLYTYVGPKVESAHVEPVKTSFIWDDTVESLPKILEFLDASLTTNCVMIGLIATWNDAKKRKKKA